MVSTRAIKIMIRKWYVLVHSDAKLRVTAEFQAHNSAISLLFQPWGESAPSWLPLATHILLKTVIFCAAYGILLP